MELPAFFTHVETCLVACVLGYIKKKSVSTFETRDVRELLKQVHNDLQKQNSSLKPLFPGILAADFQYLKEVFNRYVHKGLSHKAIRI
jgi:hypothetical protein